MEVKTSQLEDRLLDTLHQYRTSLPFTREEKKKRLLSQVDVLLRTQEGFDLLEKHIGELVEANIFENTVWQHPRFLVASLIGGTLLSGTGSSSMEILSEIRLMAIAKGNLSYKGIDAAWARDFLKDALVRNFELAYENFRRSVWKRYPEGELKKIRLLFKNLRQFIPIEDMKGKLCAEIETFTAQRPIVTTKVEKMLFEVREQLDLTVDNPVNRRLNWFVQAMYEYDPDDLPNLDKWSKKKLKDACFTVAEHMCDTGLVSAFHLHLLRHVVVNEPELTPVTLGLNSHGEAEYERHEAFINMLVTNFFSQATKQAVYALFKVLQRNLLSRKLTWNAMNRLIRVKIHPTVAKKLKLGNSSSHETKPIDQLVWGILACLGQPLGIRQGNNPTCQSARAISMWARHAPGKLINLLIDAATTNNVIFRYEGQLIEAADIDKGIAQEIDFKLDPVSIVLIPLLDRIYSEMMKMTAFKYPGTDPHISVNPAFYGHWIQTGFKSVYNPLNNTVENYNEFVRIFYASFHPDYNGGHHLIYPVPLGVFITDTQANLLGYHAVSLVRIEKDEQEYRAYFFNPNSEGPQNWGQGIEPSVSGHGEFPGESSLPVHEFASRVYAFHYNHLRLGEKHQKIPKRLVNKVIKLSKESWGRKYVWNPLKNK